MSGAWMGWGLVAAAMLPATTTTTSARAESSGSRPDLIGDTPALSIDMGAGMMQPGFTATTFSSLDTWNGQHTLYHSSGASLGVAHPLGWSFWGALHVFPVPSLRVIGLVATGELGGFGANMTTGQTAFGAIDPSTNFYCSVVAGPEAQLRMSSLLLRAAVLGGGRYTTVADFSALEWRFALRGQIDYVIDGVRRGGTALTLGLFGAGDVVPAPGWSAGASLSMSFL